MLHSAISDAIKNVTAGRNVKYKAEPYVWSDDAGNAVELYWTITRTAQSSLQYVALTKSAAESAAQSLVAQYTRKYARWKAELNESTTPPTPVIIESNSLECTSNIRPAQSAGDAWEIDIDVNDSDSVIVTEKPETYADMERLFTLALARDAEADGATAIVVTEAHWDSGTGKVAAFYDVVNVADFSAALVQVQRKQGASWVNVAGAVAGAGGVTFPATQNLAFRISYNSGAILSNVYTTNDAPLPAIAIDDGTWNKSVKSTTGAIRIVIPFTATGVPQVLANIENATRWRVTLTGGNSGVNYGRYTPAGVANLGGGVYALTVWANVASASELLSVTIGFSVGDGPSATATAVFYYSDYFDVKSATLLDASPAQTRVRITVASDLGADAINRATFSIVGRYPGVNFSSDRTATGTVEQIYAIDDSLTGLYSIVVSFSTLDYRLASYPLTISGTIATAGISVAFSAPAVTVAQPAQFITEVVQGSSSSSVKYTAYDVGDNWQGVNLDMKKWNPTNGAWAFTGASTGSGAYPNYQANYTADYSADYLAVWDTNVSAPKSVFICPGAVYTRIVSATWADGELSIIFDQRHYPFDPSLLAVYDATAGATLTATVAGDTVTATLAGDGTAHSVYLVYNSIEKSAAVSVATEAPGA